jgi:nitrogenase-stabilizing/protective protein
MSDAPPTWTPGQDLRARWDALSSAEDLFALLDVACEPRVLAPARLHILKRFGQYLAEHDLDVMGDEAFFAAARDALHRAYADFVASSPREQRVFDELERRGRAAAGFVGLDALRPPPA